MGDCEYNAGGYPAMDYQPSQEGVEMLLLYLPTQIRFLIGGEYHGSNLHDALGRTKLHNSLLRDQVVHLETAVNLSASRPDVKRPLKSGNVYY